MKAIVLGLLAVSGYLPLAAQTAPIRLTINAGQGRTTISRHIYGHFAEHLGRDIYDGFWRKGPDGQWGYRDDVIEALKKIKAPNVRWPGGCFADYYHWKDGIGPRDKRPTIVNTLWGGVTEDNSFGLHEFLELTRRLGAEPFLVGNVGSGSVQEMAQWWEYVNFPGKSPMADLRRANGREQPWNVRYWGVGNESWGCGGNMRPEYYADLYKHYATFLHGYPNVSPFRVATGPIARDTNWTKVLMRDAGRFIDGLDWHHYIWSEGSATRFGEREWFDAMQKAVVTENVLREHTAIMDRYDPQKRVALIVGEWGMWHHVEPGTNPGFLYQQNTMRDALVAAVSLNIFNRNADRVRMATIAQTVNVLQAMILTKGDSMLVTPSYHVFDLYKVHHDATLLPLTLDSDSARYTYQTQSLPAISASASRDREGKIHLTLANIDPNRPRTVTASINGANIARVSGQILTALAITSHNTFAQANTVQPAPFTGATISANALTINLPAKSIVALELIPQAQPQAQPTATTPTAPRLQGATRDLVLEFDRASGTIKDASGKGTGFTTRLPGSGANFAANDPNLTLDPSRGVLSITTTTTDINGQTNMSDLEALGVSLKSLGFTGAQDFSVTARFTGLPPDRDGYSIADQLGVFVGTSTTALVRAGLIVGGGYSVLTNGERDSGPNFSGAPVGETMTVEITRTGGVWRVLVNGVETMPNSAQDGSGDPMPPAFLNGQSDLVVGVFALDVLGEHRTLQVDRFSVSVAAPPARRR